MKTALPVLLALSASAAGVANAAETNQTSNTTAEITMENAITADELVSCIPPPGWVGRWSYNERGGKLHNCAAINDNARWSMLNAYRMGGTQNVHWKYTNDRDDKECMNNWKYYSSDGQTLFSKISGRTTTMNDPTRWCPLRVYRPGGVRGKQWDYCTDCKDLGGP